MCLAFLSKYILFFVNLIFVLGGAALITAGVLALVNLTDFLELIPVNINLIPISVIVLGSIIFTIAFFGCYGAITENRCFLVMYAVIMLILAALNIWLAVVLFQNMNDLENTVEGWLNDAFGNENTMPAFIGLEVALRCCGTTGPDAYTNQGWPIPASCCSNPVGNFCEDSDYIGCNDRLGSYFSTFGNYIAYGVIVIVVVEFIAMLLSLYLNQSITSKRRKMY